MTTTLLKYMLNGMLKGIEEYEAMLEKEHVDPTGKLADILRAIKVSNVPVPTPPLTPLNPVDKINLDDLLEKY